MNINATIVIQAIVFGILVWFTMSYVWPPIMKALDERAQKVADGLAAADKAKADLASMNKKVEQELSASRNDAAVRLADAERRAQGIIEEAKAKAVEEGNKIIAAAQAEAQQQVSRARDSLRDEVASLAVKGAEQIPRKEVNASVQADLHDRLKAEL